MCCERACSCSTFHFFRVCACFFHSLLILMTLSHFLRLLSEGFRQSFWNFFFAIENVINRAQIQIVVMMFWLVLLPPYGFRV